LENLNKSARGNCFFLYRIIGLFAFLAMKLLYFTDASVTLVAYVSVLRIPYKRVQAARIKMPPGGEEDFPGGFTFAPSGNSFS
jgi:hypothetical protein